MVFFFRLIDQPDVDGTMDLGTSKNTKSRHIRFSENFGLVIADNQYNIGP